VAEKQNAGSRVLIGCLDQLLFVISKPAGHVGMQSEGNTGHMTLHC